MEVEFPMAGRRSYVKLVGSGCGISLDSMKEHFPFTQIDVIGGTCLFGADKFLLRTADGRATSLTFPGFELTSPVEEILIDPHLSVYECDLLLGLSSFINGLYHWNTAKLATAYLEIPRGAYYLYLVPAYLCGLLSADLFRRAMEEIDARHARLLRLYRKYLRVPCLEVANPLAALECYLRRALWQGGSLSLCSALEILGLHPIWRRVLSVETVNDWSDISRLSHVVVLLERECSMPGHVAVQIDDPIQEKIRYKASRIIRKLGATRHYAIWGIYPMQTVFLDPERNPDSDLFFGEPAIPLDFMGARTIISAARGDRRRARMRE